MEDQGRRRAGGGSEHRCEPRTRTRDRCPKKLPMERTKPTTDVCMYYSDARRMCEVFEEANCTEVMLLNRKMPFPFTEFLLLDYFKIPLPLYDGV